MAQNNIEKEFSRKLNERTIQPSGMAWDRLDAMLSVTEGKKAAKKYNWMYVAAGLLGFLFIGMLFLNQTEELNDIKRNDVVIGNETETEINPALTTQEQEAISLVPDKASKRTAVAGTESGQQEKKASHGAFAGTGKAVKVITREALPVIAHQNQIPRTDANGRNQNLATTHQINNQAIAHTDINGAGSQKTTAKSSYVNVDELLASVERVQKNEAPKPGIKVDANSLLSQVDGELELSFRERAIQTVNKKFQTVRVALSNRNVQE